MINILNSMGLSTEEAMDLTQTLVTYSDSLQRILTAVGSEKDVILTPKQASDLLNLVARLTYMNTGISGAVIEMGVAQRMEQYSEE